MDVACLINYINIHMYFKMKTHIIGTPKSASLKKPKTRNVPNALADKIFLEYYNNNITLYKEIDEVLDISTKKQLKDLPYEIELTLKKSDYCSSNILTTDLYPDKKCSECERLSIFTEDEIVEDYIEIQAGNLQDEFLIIDRYPLISLKYKLTSESNNIYFYTTEDDYLQLITTYIFLKNLSVNKNFPISTSFIYSYTCRNNYCIIQKEEKLFEEFKGNKDYQFYSVIKQLISLLHFLNTYNFVHGNPSIEYLSVEEKFIKYKYNHISINSEYNLKFNICTQSSISLHDGDNFYHFIKNDIKFNNPVKSLNSYKGINYVDILKLKIPYYPGFKDTRIIGFQVSEPIQIPFFSGSFDCCCFLTSIMCDKKWREELMKNSEFMEIWKGLWKEDEYSDFMKNIKNFKSKNNFKNIFKLIKGYHIRCDAIEYFFEALR